MTETFRQRALAEMGLSSWVSRIVAPRRETGAALTPANAPDAQDSVVLDVIGSRRKARVAVRDLAALDLAELPALMQLCSACDRADSRRAVGLPQGPFKATLMVIEEAPAAEPLSADRAGAANLQRLFEQMLFSVGVSLSQVYTTHLVRCDGAAPNRDQIAACSTYLEREIELIQPRAILAFESLAEQAARKIAGDIAVFMLPHPRALLGNGVAKKAAWMQLLKLKGLLAVDDD